MASEKHTEKVVRKMMRPRDITGFWLSGLVLLLGGLVQKASGQFSFNNVSLESQIPLSSFTGTPSTGNDCWGYTSPSGREYALMGLSNSLAVVEITTPALPVIVAQITHTNSLWGDIKTFDTFAYVVNEAGGGMDVIDLSDVDNGNVTLVQRITANGLSDVHNIAIDEVSGFLYLCIPNINLARLVAYDLTDPANPVLAGMMTAANGGMPLHDAHVVTFTSGPNAGKQICFGAGERRGLDIIDVTDKANMFLISRTTYPGLKYSHQCWLSDDGQHLYLNDELDEQSDENITLTRTIVFDVSDLANPVQLGTFSTGLLAIDHNLYVRDGFIYQSNYTTGLRIFNACDPVNPREVGFFDTRPETDAAVFQGAWSVYPFFPSGTVIVSDFQRALFVFDVSAALDPAEGSLIMTLPDPIPARISPDGATLAVDITGCGESLVGGSATLHFDIGAGDVSVPLTPVGGSAFEAVFPALSCQSKVSFYITAEDSSGNIYRKPSTNLADRYETVVARGVFIDFEDDMETNGGWTVQNTAITGGAWEINPEVPVGGGARSDPQTDFDGSGKCWLTQNMAGNSDVDGGPTRLISPVYDVTALADPHISYARWFNAISGNVQRFEVEISDDAGASWISVESVDNIGVWQVKTIRVADFVVPNDQIRLRFSVMDNPNVTTVEAGLDALRIFGYLCKEGDATGDNAISTIDLLAVLINWGSCEGDADHCPMDFNSDGVVSVFDLLVVLTKWGS